MKAPSGNQFLELNLGATILSIQHIAIVDSARECVLTFVMHRK